MQRALAQQREELERFADVLVHDLKSPISSIRGFATIISHAIKSGKADPDKIAGYCERVVHLGERMVALVDTLHEYTKSEAHVEFEPVTLNLVVEDALSNLDQIISKSGARVTHDDLPLVLGHAPLLTQLLQNLIGNADQILRCDSQQCTFRQVPRVTASGASAFVTTVSASSRNFTSRSSSRSSGCTTAANSKAPASVSPPARKSSIAISGRIWCESNPDGGTTFNFNLPVPAAGGQAGGGGERLIALHDSAGTS